MRLSIKYTKLQPAILGRVALDLAIGSLDGNFQRAAERGGLAG